MFHTYSSKAARSLILMSHQLQMKNIYLCLHSKLKMKLVIEPIIIRIAKQSEEEEKEIPPLLFNNILFHIWELFKRRRHVCMQV